MIIELKPFKQKGIYQSNFSFDYEPKTQLLQIPNAKFANGVTVSGEFDVQGTDVYVSGCVSFAIAGECARCLEQAKVEVSLDFDEKFVIFKNEDNYIYSKDCVDLSQMVDDLILSQAPLTIYCKPDCKGLCPTCGKNLNDGDCDCLKNL